MATINALGTKAAQTKVYKRVVECKKKVGLTWSQICKQAGIPMASWMTGVPTSEPTDEELRKMAPVLQTTYEYLKYGTK